MGNEKHRDIEARRALRRVIAAQIDIIRTLALAQCRNNEYEAALKNMDEAIEEIKKALNILNDDESN
ncbi:MAG: hypothetical protein IPI17_12480 [Nitrosomonas sp.]|jgi:hypothetical protein|nr:hypothetical protein [Nitrosomonas sp.]